MSDLALSLVYAWLLTNPEYYSQFVQGHWSLRTVDGTSVATRVAGHYRRSPLYAKLLRAIPCTCKIQTLVVPRLISPPDEVMLQRVDEEGYVPRRLRAYVFA